MNIFKLAKLSCIFIAANVLLACAQQNAELKTEKLDAGVNEPSSQSSVVNKGSKNVVAHKSALRIKPAEPVLLESWNNTKSKTLIQQFVKSTLDESAQSFLPVSERVAVFDLDGTLWVEKPQKAMVNFVKMELLEQLKRDPSLKSKQPWKSVARGDEDYLARLNFSTSYLSLLKAHAGLTQTAYSYKVKAFFEHDLHSEFKRPQLQLAYKPMQELIRYLQSYDYQVYIVDGSENAFIRHFAEDLFNVPAENIIGSSTLLIWRDGSEKLVRHDEFVAPVNDRDGKPVNIERYIGRRPAIAIGNDASDAAMLTYVAESKRDTLVMFLKHDDAKREYRYSAPVLEKLAKQRAWLEVSMQNDFKRIF